MRWMIRIASGLVLGVGIALFVFSEQTETRFAWTIQPPLTAAFLGGCYWAAFVLEALVARSKTWTEARVAIPGVLIFTTLTNIPTFQNLDNYRLDAIVAWVWVATYMVVPVVMAALLYLQLRLPGTETPRTAPLPRPLRGALLAIAVPFVGLGVAMMVAPEASGALWPWELNPAESTYQSFTEPYLGCWLIGLGCVAGHAFWENDYHRNRSVFPSMAALGVLQLVAVVRFGDVLDTASPSVWLYFFILLGLLAVGLCGVLLRPRPEQ